jgi:hypothetical protein
LTFDPDDARIPADPYGWRLVKAGEWLHGDLVNVPVLGGTEPAFGMNSGGKEVQVFGL